MQTNQLTDDQTLIELSRLGDDNALNILFSKYYKKLIEETLFMIRDREVSEDIVQDTFIKATSSIREGDLKEGNFFGWLFTVNQNKCMDYFRRIKKRNSTSLFGDEYSISSTSFTSNNDFFKIESKEYIMEALNILPPIYKEIIELRFIVGFTDKEICEMFGKPIRCSTYRSRVFLALNMLREIVKNKQF